ncbi:phospholipase D-like domain-containing protein [Bacillus sp. FJAT-27986]|uniref:phospholipase D-like domain-containing protein n=1 Tax=Bacillus sp. FJAT-27986 TaxID=1743146 RepID=UPI00080AE020|nr:phospholipase D-like domain-containing protein [Bacillus sp. FJAT-27986]OCA86163.1 hypothetical protein A8L44_07035 [Bacillus sp. FJAT-27986]
MNKVQLISHDLINHLTQSIRQAKSCYILTSFVMNSGVKLLEPLLKEAAENGADIKICTGDYLYITQPEALKRLMNIHPEIETRIRKSEGISFHPKAYIFEKEEEGIFYIGSSNMSKSALTKGVEWNLAVAGETEDDVVESVITEFLEVFHNTATVPLNEITVQKYEAEYIAFHNQYPQLQTKWTQQEELDLTLPVEDTSGETSTTPGQIIEPPKVYNAIAPRFAQKPALEELQKIQEEGYDKAMVVMATGLGKTYLAAFFAKHSLIYIRKIKKLCLILQKKSVIIGCRCILKGKYNEIMTYSTTW